MPLEPLTIQPLPGGSSELRREFAALRPAMRRLLRDAIAHPSLSGREKGFVDSIEAWARGQGLLAESWEAAEEHLAAYPQARLRHLPLAGRPTLLVRLPGVGGGRDLLFNAHSDVVPAGAREAWRFDPWGGAQSAGRIYGRGAADDKGPLIAALWALAALRRAPGAGLPGDVLLELVPGEEDCVGLGTLTSLARGVHAAGVIVLEPTEGLPRRASRSGCRFRIEAAGRAVHGTVKWLGTDAIALMRRVLAALETLEARWNEPGRDPLFGAWPIARPVTVDALQGGQGQGMLAERCACEGYLELLPGDDMDAWQSRFEAELRELLGPGPGRLTVGFGERYWGHVTPAEDPLCRLAAAVAARHGAAGEIARQGGLIGFNSGCEAGLRARLEGAPTLVWGPGSLAQAHAADEFIEFGEVERAALMFAEMAMAWTRGR